MWLYCAHCKKKSNVRPDIISVGGRRRATGKCKTCGRPLSKFITGGSLINKAMNIVEKAGVFPELHLWKGTPFEHNFTGPGTNLKKRLNTDGTPKAWSKPVNRVDLASYHHDLEYEKSDRLADRHDADRKMLAELDAIKNPTIRERIDRSIVRKIIATKVKKGWGVSGGMYIMPVLQHPETHKLRQHVKRGGMLTWERVDRWFRNIFTPNWRR